MAPLPIFISHAPDEASVGYAKELAEYLRAELQEELRSPVPADTVRCQYELSYQLRTPLDGDPSKAYPHEMQLVETDLLEFQLRARPVTILLLNRQALTSRALEASAQHVLERYYTDPLAPANSEGTWQQRLFFPVLIENVRQPQLWRLLDGLEVFEGKDEAAPSSASPSGSRYERNEIVRHRISAKLVSEALIKSYTSRYTFDSHSFTRVSQSGGYETVTTATGSLGVIDLGKPGDPKTYTERFQQGCASLMHGQLSFARAHFRKALAIKDTLEARYFLAVAYFNDGNFSKCDQVLTDTLHTGVPPTTLVHCAYALRGLSLAMRDRHQEAIDCYKQARQVTDTVAWTWLQFGRSMVELAKPEFALDAFTRAHTLDPHMPEALTELSAWHRNLQQFERARAFGQSATALKMRFQSLQALDKEPIRIPT